AVIAAVVLLAAITAALLLSPLTFGAAPAPAQPLPFEGRVNQVTTADQHEPTLAVDPTNPNNLLAAAKDWRTGPKQVWHYRSTDGGRTWADGHIDTFPRELPNQSDPVGTFDAS